jgi:hypothetical protein
MNKLLPAIALLAASAPHPAWAAGSHTAAAADDISAPAKSRMAPRPVHLLWDNWYTATVGKDTHYEYYNVRVELKDGRVAVQNHAWKLEEDYINEEQLGVFAANDSELSPLFFNYHQTFRSSELTIDGTISNGKQLIVHARRGGEDLPLIKKMVPSKTFFSELFPVWLGKHLGELKEGRIQPFQAIFEDDLDNGFATVNGEVRLEKPDERAKETHTRKLTVDIEGRQTLWWVDDSGAAVRTERKNPPMVVQKVTRETALKFLDK